jgi:hypothetical protein
MTAQKSSRHVPACPSCGLPVESGGFKISEKVKTALALLLVGYIVVSALLLRASLPPEMRRHQRPADWDVWLQPLSREPIFQIVVGIGVALGALIFYWDFFYEIYANWQAKHKATLKEPKKAYRYKCRACGREWS